MAFLKKAMGLESFKNIKLAKKLSNEELFGLIKDADYPCGKPELKGNGNMKVIEFSGDGFQRISVGVALGIITVAVVQDGFGGLAKGFALDAVTKGYGTTAVRSGQKSDFVQEIGKIIRDILEPLGYLK